MYAKHRSFRVRLKKGFTQDEKVILLNHLFFILTIKYDTLIIFIVFSANLDMEQILEKLKCKMKLETYQKEQF